MIKLFNGQDSTLENYINLCKENLGTESPATLFFEKKAASAKDGIHAEVIAPESQVMILIDFLHREGESCLEPKGGVES